MTHLWVRAEERPDEERVGLMPDGAATLLAHGIKVTVEESPNRAVPLLGYQAVGAEIAPMGSWRDAPANTIVFGLKELVADRAPLRHRHIMFGHAYKGQADGLRLLRRFKAGGGALYDLEYLVDRVGRRVAAFGYWAGYAGAAVALQTWAALQAGTAPQPARTFPSPDALADETRATLKDATPSVIVIGAMGRVGTGARALVESTGGTLTLWDLAETVYGGPFPEILEHDVFLNCILASAETPVFVPKSAVSADRRLQVIGDIACDPGSAFNPIPIYDHVTSWSAPAHMVASSPPLAVTAIDNLPSMLPEASSADYAAQLLPALLRLPQIETGEWARARDIFDTHIARLT